jgi:hypothetical protein
VSDPRRFVDAATLLHGDDQEFVVNLYVAALRRWPDATGLRRYLEIIANRPERRLDVVREVAGSEEARRHGALVTIPDRLLPSDPARARAVLYQLRTEVLFEELSRLREAVALLSGMPGQELARLQQDLAEAREGELRTELNALRRELREALGPRPAPTASEAAKADLAAGLAQLLDAYLDDRLRGFEARLAALEARLPP